MSKAALFKIEEDLNINPLEQPNGLMVTRVEKNQLKGRAHAIIINLMTIRIFP
jgi:hypothetical protein